MRVFRSPMRSRGASPAPPARRSAPVVGRPARDTLRRSEIRHILHGPLVQPEREADRAADAVLRMPEPEERIQATDGGGREPQRVPIRERSGPRVMRDVESCGRECEEQFERCLETTRFPPECLAARQSCLTLCRPRVLISSASIPNDRIVFHLRPADNEGDLTLRLLGDGVSHDVFTGRLRSGDYRTSFGIPSLPEEEFTRLVGIWRVGGTDYTGGGGFHIKVLGSYRHSQYNIPHESSCTGAALRAYVTDSDCNFTRTTLRARFISQVNLNGSGVSIDHGNLQKEAYCVGRPGAPGDAANRSFRQAGDFHGSCGGNTGALGNSTVARRPNHPDLDCDDRVYIHTQGVKTVTDLCPGCAVAQLDNFTTATDCSGITDLGNFLTIKLF